MYYLLLFILLKSFIFAEDFNKDFFIKVALEKNPSLKIEEKKIDSFYASYQKETVVQNPMLMLRHQNIPQTTWPFLNKDPMSMVTVGIRQTIALPYEFLNRKKESYYMYSGQTEIAELKKRDIVREVSITYYTFITLLNKKSILEENYSSLENIIRLVRSLVEVNKISATQLLVLEGELSVLQNQIYQNLAEITKSKFMLEELCASSFNWDTFDQSSYKQYLNIDVNAIPKEFKFQDHSLFKIAQINLNLAKTKVSSIKSKLFPEVSVDLEYGIRQKVDLLNHGDNMISIGISTPIPIYYPLKEKYAIQEAKINENIALEELRKIEIQLTSLWNSESNRINDLLQSYNILKDKAIHQYLGAYKAQLSILPYGTISLLDVMESYRRYLDISMNLNELYLNLKISLTYLEYLIEQKKYIIQENNNVQN